MSSSSSAAAASAKKIVYGNDLMLKLRHMAPQPPTLASIPEGARNIFVLPNAANGTVHTVTVQKKAKTPASTAAAAASSGFTVRAEPAAAASTAANASKTSPAATDSAATTTAAASAGYAAALLAMSDAERAKLQEVRNAFVLRAAETKQMMAVSPAKTAAAAKPDAASTEASGKKGWNTATAANGIDIAAAVADKTTKPAAPKKTSSSSTTTAAVAADAPPAEKAPPKQWSKVGGAVDAVNLAEVIAEPITRGERKRQEEAKRTASSSKTMPANTAATANKGKKSTASAANNNGTAAPRAARNNHHHAPERFPAFMVNANAVNLPQQTATADGGAMEVQSFFVGPDGRQYPIPANPFTTMLQQQQQQSGAKGLSAPSPSASAAMLGNTPVMNVTEWYGWWAQQAAFFPEYYPVPVEVPVDSEGNVLPFSALQKLRQQQAKAAAAEAKKAKRQQIAAEKSAAAVEAKLVAAKGDTDADGNIIAAANGLGKGRSAPAVLTGESLEARHRQRERQIVLGKRTMGYLIYEKMRAAGAASSNKATSSSVAAAAVLAAADGGASAANANVVLSAIDIPSDCHAPPFAQPCSKRSWDGQVRRWRNALHKLDNCADLFLTAEEMARFPSNKGNKGGDDVNHTLNYDEDEDEGDE